MITSALALAAAPAAHAAPALPPSGRLTFEVWRNKSHIGHHGLVFKASGDDLTISTEVEMRVGLGPFTFFRYGHRAEEVWRGGGFAYLQSRSETNGKHEWVSAMRSPTGVDIRTQAGRHGAPAGSLPLTHWNESALQGPLFNPQTGALVRVTAQRVDGQSVKLANGRSIGASRVTLAGEAQIIDWYDAHGVWTGLRGRVQDGSYLDYLRAA